MDIAFSLVIYRTLLLLSSGLLFFTFLAEIYHLIKRGKLNSKIIFVYLIQNLDRLAMLSVFVFAISGLILNLPHTPLRNIWLGVSLSIIFTYTAIWKSHLKRYFYKDVTVSIDDKGNKIVEKPVIIKIK